MQLIHFSAVISNPYLITGMAAILIGAVAAIWMYIWRGRDGIRFIAGIITLTFVILEGITGLAVLIPRITPTATPGLAATTILRYHTHAESAYDIKWSPDGTRIASQHENNAIRIWDATTGKLILTHDVTAITFSIGSWSPDGKRLAIIKDRQLIDILDIATDKVVLSNGCQCNVITSFSWSPDGKRIAIGSDDHLVRVWDTASGAHLLTYNGHRTSVISIAWQPDSRHIISVDTDGTRQTWDVLTGDSVATSQIFLYPDVLKDDFRDSDLSLSPDGKRIAFMGVNQVRVWDTLTGAHALSYTIANTAFLRIQWSPDSKLIAASISSPDMIQVWNANSGNDVLTLNTQAATFAWSPDSTRIASAETSDLVRIWRVRKDIGTSERFSLPGNVPPLVLLALLSIIVIIAVALFFILRSIFVGQASQWSIGSIVYIVLIAIAGAIVLTLFASGIPQPTSKILSNGMIVSAYRGVVIAWSPDSAHIAIGLSDGTVHEWDTYTEEHILRYYSSSGSVTALAWSPDGTYIASGYDNGTIQIWNATTGQKLFTYMGHTNPVVAIAWSSDGMRIASASEPDKMVRVWQAGPLTGQLEDRIKLVTTVAAIVVLVGGLLVAWRYRRRTRSETRKRIAAVALVLLVLGSSIGVALLITQLAQSPLFRSLPTLGTTIATHQGNALTWSPDATRIASTSGDGTVQIWNAATASAILTYNSSKLATFSVTWSPDGKYIASGHNDGIVHVWNATNGHTIFTNEGHSHAVRAVAWSPDGAQIASADDDNTMQVWDALTGHHLSGYHLITYPGHGETVAWSPDGTNLASANLSGLVQVRQMYEKIDLYTPFQRQINRDTLSLLLFCDAALLIAFTLATSFHRAQSFLWKTKSIQAALIVTLAILICVVNVAQNMMQRDTHYSSTPHPIKRTALYKYTGVTVAWAPDGKHFATTINDSNRVFIRDTASGDLSFVYRNHSGTVRTLAWSPDGVHIASGYADGSIQIWEAATGKNLLTYHGHTKEVFTQAWSPDSTRIISVSEDQTAQIWNALTGQPLFVVHHGFSWLGVPVSWSRGGRYVTIADDDWQILDAISGQVIYHSNALGASSGAWAPDGKHIALVFDSGAFLAVGAVAGQDTIYFSREARDSIYTLSWSPDSKYIAAGTSSGLIEIWDAHTAKLVFSYELYCMFMEVVAWSSDGKHIASVGLGDSNIQIWQI